MTNALNESEKVQKKWVWVPCSKNLYKPGYVLEEASTQTSVQSDITETFSSADIFKMNPTKFDRVEDLASLSHLNEPSVLHNLEMRYNDSEIYTYSGLFLIALNPYHSMNIYNDDIKKHITKGKLREGKPHIFAVANEAYKSMITNKENQSILITGESGAGKTENTKRVIEFLAFVAGGLSDEKCAGNDNNSFNIKAALMSANPVLEAFGNAKTVKNDNSSRFGKFIQIKFRGGRICGAKIEKYLLEKSRVTNASSEERNFHIFYYILKGLPDKLKKELFLTGNPADYNCLKNTHFTIQNVDDAAEFVKLNDSFAELGVGDALPLYKIVSIILHLSNMEFIEQNDQCLLKDSHYNPLDTVCSLLGISYSDLLNAIIHPVMKAGNEFVVQYRNKAQATAVVEGLMKMLYELLFDTLIAIINKKLDSTCDSYIGILDIAGFEIFKNNSFEQLCINYTNEKLQQYFNHHMFILEQEIYRNEEIKWDFIDFGLDLEPTIHTIESSNPIGILSYLDEECVMPCANDDTLLAKLKAIKMVENVPFKNNFRIKHYAGQVEYEVKDWLRKNKDTESEVLLGIIKGGITSILDVPALHFLNACNSSFLKHNSLAIKKGAFKTVAQSHKESLRWLMDTLKETQPHFVRCILPNMEKSPGSFNKKLVLDQLRCNGVLEGIRISRLGYPSRQSFNDFNNRYTIIIEKFTDQSFGNQAREEKGISVPRNTTQTIADALKLNKNNYRIGRTMIFFRQGVIADLEELRDKKILGIAEAIQNLLKSKLAIKMLTLDADRLRAVTMLQKDARLCMKLLKWKWWSLFLKIQPLLDVKKAENDKRVYEEELSAFKNELNKQAEDAASKDRIITSMELAINQLQNDIAKKESESTDREGLLSSLRNENTKIPILDAQLKEKDILVRSLSEQIELAADRESNHSNEYSKLSNRISELKNIVLQKDAEIDCFVKQDLGNILQMKDAELVGLKERVGELEKSCSMLTALNKKSKDVLDHKNQTYKDLQNICDQKTAECFELQQKLDESLVACVKHVGENDRMVSKLKAELADLQLENDNLSSKDVQMECGAQVYKENIHSLEQQLDYQKARNTSLEASIQLLKNLKSTDKEVSEPADESRISNDQILQGKMITSLKTKLAHVEKMNDKLIEEKDALYNENLKLMQSKLNDLFNNESEFSMAKATMQAEIRKLEAENAGLRKEIMAVQSVSDYSEDFGFEKLNALLEEERNQRKVVDMKLIDLENTNMKLQNTVDGLEKEVLYLEGMNSENQNRSVTRNDLKRINDEINQIRKSVGSISETFMNDFMNLMAEKDEFYGRMIGTHGETLEKLGCNERELESLRKDYELVNDELVSLKKKYAQGNNEIESLTVTNKANAVAVKELKHHISKLEDAYNEREDGLSVIRKKYDQTICDLEVKRNGLIEQVNILKEKVYNMDHRTYDAELREMRKCYGSKIVRLNDEVEELRSANEELGDQVHKLVSEKEELKQFIDVSSSVNHEVIVRDESLDLIREKLVSSFVVDKEALKASEWKNIVGNKCTRCAEVKKEVVNADTNSLIEITGEVNLLKLKLKQSERIIEDNKRVINSMKSCMVVMRKGK